MAAVALAGFALARARVRSARAALRERPGWPVLVPVLAYVLALAPVLLAGRPSFSSYMALADSAVHMMGADFLIRHGQDYAHLDLRNSYGQFINDYYNSSYPSGADTLFGGSAFLLGLPLIWAFQPFNAFMLADRRRARVAARAADAAARARGPRWRSSRRSCRRSCTRTSCSASVKEITALSMILTLGCLVGPAPALAACGARPARFPSRSCSPPGSRRSGWRSARGRSRPSAVLASCSWASCSARRQRARRRVARAIGVAALALLIAAWPTWADLSGVPARRRDDRLDEQPGQPAHAAARDPGARRLAARQLQARAGGGRVGRDPRADRARRSRRRCSARVHLLRLRAYALVGWLALMLLASLDGERVGHHVGGREDARAHLAAGRAAGVGRGGGAAGARRARSVRRAAAAAARARARAAACSPPTRCSTTARTSRRPRATKSWRR